MKTTQPAPVFEPPPKNIKVRSTYYPDVKLDFNTWINEIFNQLKPKQNGK